jgi:hypothetical protein
MLENLKPYLIKSPGIQRYKLQSKHDMKTSPAWGRRGYTMLDVKSKQLMDVREGLLAILKLTRAYHVPVCDSRVSDLITWYVVTMN